MLRRVSFNLIFALFFLYSTPYVSCAQQWFKIPIKTNGIYYIYGQDLQKAGIDISTVDPATFRLFNQGEEVAINVSSQNDSFWLEDYIEFYGTGIPRESRQFNYTEENIYWLTFGGSCGSDQCKHALIKDGTPGSLSSPQYFKNQIHMEKDLLWWGQMPQGEEEDHWFWIKLPRNETATITFPVKDPYRYGNECVLRYALYGRTDDPISLDHHTKFHLNGYLIDDHTWDGISELKRERSFSCSYINDGSNTLKFESIDTGAEVNSIYLNWVEIDYYATFTAENNQLTFSVTGNSAVDITIKNFTIIDPLVLFDITDPLDIKKIINFGILSDGKSIRFRDTIEGTRKYLIQIATSPELTLIKDSSSNLQSPDNGADYIIITHPDFYSSIMPLADHRRNQGYRVKVVSIEDIYDEFSHGIFDPLAIKDFLRYAYSTWRPQAPAYVLLVGDANMDYRDNWDTGEQNFIPTYLYKSEDVGLIPTDNRFVSFDSQDPSPQMAIGRLPVKNADDVTDIVNKIIKYESDPETEWHKNILFVADDADRGETEFETLLDTLEAEFIPPYYNLKKVYLGRYQSEDIAREDVASGIKEGSLITVYTGHGAVDQWAEENLLNSDMATYEYLQNYNRPTFVITLNCLNGFFALPKEGTETAVIPLAEALLKVKSNAGALALWSPTGLGYTWQHSLLAETLFDIIFNEGEAVLGKAIIRAKGVAYRDKGVSRDMVEMYTLFGDPATRLKKASSASTGGGSGGGGCFIATAAYGSSLHPYIKYLQDFRDTYLMNNESGRAFVHLYYKYSPPIAQYVAERPILRLTIRILLLPLVLIAWILTALPHMPAAIIIIFTAAAVLIFIPIWIKKYPLG